jgi:hypothetical protein
MAEHTFLLDSSIHRVFVLDTNIAKQTGFIVKATVSSGNNFLEINFPDGRHKKIPCSGVLTPPAVRVPIKTKGSITQKKCTIEDSKYRTIAMGTELSTERSVSLVFLNGIDPASGETKDYLLLTDVDGTTKIDGGGEGDKIPPGTGFR